MRKLSKGQKRILIDYVKSDFFNSDLLIEKYGNENILLRQLENKNDYETLYSDYKRLKQDLLFKDTIEEKINCINNF